MNLSSLPGTNDDLLVTLLRQGSSFSGLERHCGFLNNGGSKRFADVSDVSGLSLPEDGTGIGFCDWDQDGDLDLWMSNRSAPQVRFFRNENQWDGGSVGLLLEGTQCHRDAIGARVVVVTAGGATISRTLRAGEGFLSQSSKWLHFGLGSEEIMEVRVRWPGGAWEVFAGVSRGGKFRLKQGAGSAEGWERPGKGVNLPEVEASVPATEKGAVVLGIPLPLPSLFYESWSGQEALLYDEAFRGKRGVLVNLWSCDCEPCREELRAWAHAGSLARNKGLGVLALSVDGLAGGEAGGKRAKGFLSESGFSFPSGKATQELLKFLQLVNDELLVAQRLLPVPTSFLIDENWRLVAIYKGPVTFEEALQELDRLALPLEERRAGLLPFPGRWHFTPKNFVMLAFADRLFQRGLFDEGMDLVTRYARFLEPQPHFPTVLSNAGEHLVAAGRRREAAGIFERVLRLPGGKVVALHGLARIHLEPGLKQDQSKALDFARKAAEASNYDNSAILLTLAKCLNAVGRKEELSEVVEKALGLVGVQGSPELMEEFAKLRGGL